MVLLPSAESTLLFNKAAYENVIVLGHVQDENGQKMSKSKGNAVDPFDALSTYGADAIRWYFYINSAPWLPNRFHGKAVQEGPEKIHEHPLEYVCILCALCQY